MAVRPSGETYDVRTDSVGGEEVQVFKQSFGAAGTATPVSEANPLPVTTQTGTNQNLLFRFLDTVGDGTGTKNAIGDYSSGVTQFFIAPPSGTVYHIQRLLVCIEDASGFRADRYGALGAALTNGILVEKRTGASTTTLDMSDSLPIQTNAGWGQHNYDVELKTWGAGDEVLLARWDFSKTGGDLRLDGTLGERFTLLLNDDFSGLIKQYFQIQGFVV